MSKDWLIFLGVLAAEIVLIIKLFQVSGASEITSLVIGIVVVTFLLTLLGNRKI